MREGKGEGGQGKGSGEGSSWHTREEEEREGKEEDKPTPPHPPGHPTHVKEGGGRRKEKERTSPYPSYTQIYIMQMKSTTS